MSVGRTLSTAEMQKSNQKFQRRGKTCGKIGACQKIIIFGSGTF
jgi:hypothetical protein